MEIEQQRALAMANARRRAQQQPVQEPTFSERQALGAERLGFSANREAMQRKPAITGLFENII